MSITADDVIEAFSDSTSYNHILWEDFPKEKKLNTCEPIHIMLRLQELTGEDDIVSGADHDEIHFNVGSYDLERLEEQGKLTPEFLEGMKELRSLGLYYDEEYSSFNMFV